MFNPQPKPEKKDKKTKRITAISDKKKFYCSDGSKVSQKDINDNLKKLYATMPLTANCEAYPHLKANDHDHTISQARCKQLRKTELIWDRDNIALSSRLAHMEWESYRNRRFEEHKNVLQRMLYMKKHDPEGFEKRFQHLSDYKLMQALKNNP